MNWKYLLAIFLLILSSIVYADVPRTIDYQGRLMDAAGKPVVDATYMILVTLYDSTQAIQLWTKTYTTNTHDGYFNLTLGDSTPQWAGLDFNQKYYIGTKINTDPEMQPRQALCAAPYAMSVADSSIKLSKIDPELWQAIMPVGTILAWHKSMNGTPGLPANFVECNGQTITDLDSPYEGELAPDLNNPTPNGAGKFLRGNSISGISETDQFQDHKHTTQVSNDSNSTEYRAADAWCGYHEYRGTPTSGPISNGCGYPRLGSETRPVNMSVVWIMKIK